MEIYIASDHAGLSKKQEIVEYLTQNEFKTLEIDLKNHDTDDYPDFAFLLGEKVVETGKLGILLCGNGIGMSIASNKVKGIRAARCLSKDDAFKAKNHNGANILVLDSSIELEKQIDIIDTFIVTKNPTEERHLRRINKIKEYENGI